MTNLTDAIYSAKNHVWNTTLSVCKFTYKATKSTSISAVRVAIKALPFASGFLACASYYTYKNKNFSFEYFASATVVTACVSLIIANNQIRNGKQKIISLQKQAIEKKKLRDLLRLKLENIKNSANASFLSQKREINIQRREIKREVKKVRLLELENMDLHEIIIQLYQQNTHLYSEKVAVQFQSQIDNLQLQNESVKQKHLINHLLNSMGITTLEQLEEFLQAHPLLPINP
jgi:spore germination protein YaaH